MMKVGGLMAFVVAGAIVGGCSGGDTTTSARPQELAPTGPVKVERRDIVAYETFPGDLYVPPASEAIIHPPYNAPLEQVYVTIGKRVRKGETLMKLSIPEADANYSQASDSVRQGQTAYANAKLQNEGPLKQAKEALDNAREAEKQARTNGDADALNQATQSRQQAEQAYRDAQATFQQSMSPYQQQLDQAHSSRREAKAGTRQAEVSSPIMGTVVSLNVKPGQMVGQDRNEVLADVVNLKDIKVRADLNPDLAGKLHEGSNVVIAFDGFPNKPFDGWVVSLRTMPGAGGTKHDALIGFRNDEGVIKPGTRVTSVGIETGRANQVLAIPASAVTKDDQGRTIVSVQNGSDWKPQVVVTGLSDGTYVEIKSGLNEGDVVKPGA